MSTKKGKAKPVSELEVRLLNISERMGDAARIQVDAQKALIDLLKEMRRSYR